MKKIVGSRLPAFTKHESKLVKGAFNFIGLIHYTILSVKDNSNSLSSEFRDFDADVAALTSFDSSSQEAPVAPSGLQAVLQYFKQLYRNPPIYIHENGNLQTRVKSGILHSYIGCMLDEMRNGSNVRGYFVWLLLDVLELLDGFKSGCGLYYVDLEDPSLTRYRSSLHTGILIF